MFFVLLLVGLFLCVVKGIEILRQDDEFITFFSEKIEIKKTAMAFALSPLIGFAHYLVSLQTLYTNFVNKNKKN